MNAVSCNSHLAHTNSTKLLKLQYQIYQRIYEIHRLFTEIRLSWDIDNKGGRITSEADIEMG